MSVRSLVRPDLRAFAPYIPAAPIYDAVRLHANEASWQHDWDRTAPGLNRYPDPAAAAVVSRLAQIYDTDPERVLLARGSDDAIDALTRVACVAGTDAVVVCPPTFGMYAVAARLQGARVVEVPLRADDGFGVDARVLTEAATAAKIVYLCSPNNPTGNVVPLPIVEQLCADLQGRAFVVVDEAYAEFTAAPSAVGLAPSHDNLVVLRTLSKAYALAGARVGAAIAHPEIVSLLRAILPPYPVPTLSLHAAREALSPEAVQRVRSQAAATVERRRQMISRLAAIETVRRVWPSEANFVLIRAAAADRAAGALRDAGVLVRQFPQAPELEGCLRITVGAASENDAALQVLEGLQ